MNAWRATQLHRAPKFVTENLNGALSARLTARGRTVQRRSPDGHGLGAERQRLDEIDAASNA